MSRNGSRWWLVLVAVLAAGCATATPPPSGWTQVWQADFGGAAGSRLPATDWRYDTGTCYPGCPAQHWGTGELETMTDSTDNVALDGAGHLTITPVRTSGGWTSGRVESNRVFTAPAGGVLRVAASLRLPQVDRATGSGYWPAFWLLGGGVRPSNTGWPGTGEVDVLESVNGRPSLFGTLHCGTYPNGPCQEPTGLTSGERPCPEGQSGFHTYAVELDQSTSPAQLRWYADGRQYFRVSADQVDPASWQRAVGAGFFVVLDVAVGGGFPQAFGGQPGATTVSGKPLAVASVTVSTRTR